MTPGFTEHFRALAIAALRLEGGPLPPARGDTDPHRIICDLAASPVDVSLEPPPTWRARWTVRVRLRRGEATSAVEHLTLDARRVRLEAPPGDGPLQLEAILAHLPPNLVPPVAPSGCERVPVEDAAFGRPTRQSSVADATTPLAATKWMRATKVEAAPWWEMDLGQPLYIEAVRLRWDAPPRARVKLVLHSWPGPDGAPSPWPTFRSEGDASSAFVAQPRDVARFLRVELASDEPVSLDLASVEIAAARLLGDTLESSVRRTFALFAPRPLFVRRARGGESFDPSSTYGEVWAAVLAFASGLAPVLAPLPRRLADPKTGRSRHVVGLWAPNQPEWVIADLACIHQAWVSVPLAAPEGPERVAPVVAKAKLSAVVVGVPQRRHVAALLERCPDVKVVVLLPPGPDEEEAAVPVAAPGDVTVLDFEEVVRRGQGGAAVEWAERDPDELHGVLFTSGSTGTPKGAMRSYAAWNSLLGAYTSAQPAVHLSFQPLSHFSERVSLPTIIHAGGRIGFSAGGPRLYDDLAALRPTAIGVVPRVLDVLHARFNDELLAARRREPDRPVAELEAELYPRFRALLGDRIQSVGVGSAPPTPALMEFLRRCFPGCRVSEGYGSTECGTITLDDVIPKGVDVRLIDVPELGYRTDDAPPRGEICVKTAHVVAGYLGDAAETAARFDADGYFRTGDLGRRDPDGRVRIIGRRGDVIKLSQGEFVAPTQIEAALAHPLVEEVFVHAAPHQASVVALVVPRVESLRPLLAEGAPLDGAEAQGVLLAALREAGRAAELLPYQVPSAVAVVLEPLAASTNGKRDRRAIVARHGERLAALEGARAAPSVLEALRAAAAAVTGRELDPEADLSKELGVDSLAGVDLLAAAQARLARSVPLEAWFGATSLGDLARRIEASAGVGTGASSKQGREAEADLALVPALDAATLEAAKERKADLGREVLLTGATGFLGAHLLDALVRRTDAKVHALVRAPDEGAARARLRERFARGRIEWSSVHEERVVAVPGDLALPDLGFARETWRALEGSLDSIVHAGAVVNWLLLYGQLRRPNVLGTLEVLRLAGHGRPKALHLVSTISTAPADGDESTLLPDARALASGPYALSKWIGERHARAAAERGLPLVVYRPAMISGHSTTGDANADDAVNRYLRATGELGVALDLADERLDMTPVDFVAEAIVALAARGALRGRTIHLTNLRRSLTYSALASALVAAGVPTRPVPYAAFREALVARPSALSPLLAFYPPRGFGLKMGPWPCQGSDEALAAVGVVSPAVDERLIRVYVEALARSAPD